MRTFTQETLITSVKRLTYSGNPSKGTTATVYTNVNGYLRPLSEEQSAISGMQWGQGFSLLTEVDMDIQTGDILLINSETYTVRGKADHSRGRHTAYLKFLLAKKQA